MRSLLLACSLLVLSVTLAVGALAQTPIRTGPSGLPLPRFASLAANEVNLRTGPGQQYPTRWVYRRAGLPVQITDELDVWRRIQDPDGEQGWAHSSLLTTRRTVMVVGREPQGMFRSAAADSRLLLRAETGVIGRFDSCEQGWCRIEIEGQRGWMPRDSLWGLPPGDR